MLLGPLLAIIEAIVLALMKLLGIKVGAHQAVLSPTERLRGAVDLLHHEGKVEKQDRDMLGGLLDLRELQVSDVMVHRTEMTMVNADLPPEELVREVLASEYTRIPLWRREAGEHHPACCTPRICCARSAPSTATRPAIDVLHHRAAALVRAGDAPGLRAAQGVPPPQDPFRPRGRRIWRSRRHGDAGGHLWRRSSATSPTSTTSCVAGVRAQPDGSVGGRRFGADPRPQPRDGLAPAGRGGDDGRRPRDPRSPLDPRSRPETSPSTASVSACSAASATVSPRCASSRCRARPPRLEEKKPKHAGTAF